MSERNPSFRPDDDRQQVTMVGPIMGNNGPVTWKDTSNPNFIKTFYLRTVTDSGGNDMTWFTAEHVNSMLAEKVPDGSEFTVWKYGRKNANTGKFFGDIAIMVGTEESLAENWDNPQGGKQPQNKPTPQSQGNKPAQSANQSNPDDIGIMVECFTYAARILLANPVQAAMSSLGIVPSSEDLRAIAISLCIDRRRSNEKAPRNPRYLYDNLEFGGKETAQPVPNVDEQSASEDNSGEASAGEPEDEDLPF